MGCGVGEGGGAQLLWGGRLCVYDVTYWIGDCKLLGPASAPQVTTAGMTEETEIQMDPGL